MDAWEYVSRGSGLCHGGARRAFPPKAQADGCLEAGDFVCHSRVDFWATGADGCPKAGDFVCHLRVDFAAIKADGCPEAGDFVCHSRVDFSTIKADGCPEAGYFVCHSSVDFSTIKADGCPKAGDFVCHSGVDFSFVVASSLTGGPPELRSTSLSTVGMQSGGVSLQCFPCVLSGLEVLAELRCGVEFG